MTRRLHGSIALVLAIAGTACVEPRTDESSTAEYMMTMIDAAPTPEQGGGDGLEPVAEPSTLGAEELFQPAQGGGGAAGQSCYAVQILHHTHPENGQDSPLCKWKEYRATTGWVDKQAPFPVRAYSPGPPESGGSTMWFVWSAKDVCSDTREVEPNGDLSLPKTENRLLASIAADRACGFAQFSSTEQAKRLQGRYDKTQVWMGEGSPNRDFHCWKVPDPPPPPADPMQPAPALTAQQQACKLSKAANNIDPPPPAPSPTPEIISVAIDANASDLATRGEEIIQVEGGYTLEHVWELYAPGAIAAAIPGSSGQIYGLETSGWFGGGYSVVRLRDANGIVIGEDVGTVGVEELALVDTWGPIREAEGAAIDSIEPPELTFDESWFYNYAGAAGDPNDPFFGTGEPGHPGGSDPARTGPPGAAHAGGTHATSMPGPATPAARPSSYHGTTTPPGGAAVAHSTYRPPSAQPWTRPKPTAQVAADIVTGLNAEKSRTAAQVRGQADVVRKEQAVLTTHRQRLATAQAAEATAKAAAEAAPTDAAKRKEWNDRSLEVAKLTGQVLGREAATRAADDSLRDAVRNQNFAKANHDLEIALQALEASEAGGVVNQALRNTVTDLARERDIADAVAQGGTQPGILDRVGAFAVKMARETPINPDLPQASKDLVVYHRNWKWAHVAAIGTTLMAAIPIIMVAGAAGLWALAPIALNAWKAVHHHIAAEAINRGVNPHAIPDPAGGAPPPPPGTGTGTGTGGGVP